jgi:hypothetical protein
MKSIPLIPSYLVWRIGPCKVRSRDQSRTVQCGDNHISELFYSYLIPTTLSMRKVCSDYDHRLDHSPENVEKGGIRINRSKEYQCVMQRIDFLVAFGKVDLGKVPLSLKLCRVESDSSRLFSIYACKRITGHSFRTFFLIPSKRSWKHHRLRYDGIKTHGKKKCPWNFGWGSWLSGLGGGALSGRTFVMQNPGMIVQPVPDYITKTLSLSTQIFSFFSQHISQHNTTPLLLTLFLPLELKEQQQHNGR